MCFTCPLKLRLVVNEHFSHQNDNFELFTSPIMMSHVASRSSKQQLMMNMKPVSKRKAEVLKRIGTFPAMTFQMRDKFVHN